MSPPSSMQILLYILKRRLLRQNLLKSPADFLLRPLEVNGSIGIIDTDALLLLPANRAHQLLITAAHIKISEIPGDIFCHELPGQFLPFPE